MQKTEQKTEQQAGLGMSFCEEEGRITVFRKTLEALEWPSHYRFLYNRKMKQIAVQACGAEESGAHRVGKPDESNSGEIKCICNELFTWADVYDTANHDERRAILQQFITEIRVRKDYEISITLNASFNQVEQLKAVSTYDGAEIFEEISEKGA